MKIIWHSNAAWAGTGYGIQTGLFVPRLAEHHEIAISAFYGLQGARLQLNEKVMVLPGSGNTYGNESIQGHAVNLFGDLRGGLVLTLIDVWTLGAPIWQTMNVASWVPVDHDPAPPLVMKFFQDTGAIPIAMSKFGQERLSAFDSLYVPHGVETNVYRPIPKAEARKACGFDQDAFIVGVVAANKGNSPPRKCFPEMLVAFKAFQETHPEAKLYLHTEIMGKAQGVNLSVLMDTLGIRDSVLYPDQYRYEYDPAPPHIMANIYSSFDVLLNTAMGEGFGLAPLESQSCGVSAIVTDFSAMSEVCGAGWKVDYTREYSPQMSWQARPKVDAIVDALDRCYALPEAERMKLSEEARAHAMTYDADRVTQEHFLPVLETVAERLAERKPVELAA